MWWYYNLKGRKKEGQRESLNGPFHKRKTVMFSEKKMRRKIIVQLNE